MVRQENVLYGVALFFECISTLYAGQDAIIETYRKQCRNVILVGKKIAQNAVSILEQTKNDPEKIELLQQFDFSFCQGHPNPAEMQSKAETLVCTYNRIFPDRPRSDPFEQEEILRLMDEASLAESA